MTILLIEWCNEMHYHQKQDNIEVAYAGLIKMAHMLQTTLSNAFSREKNHLVFGWNSNLDYFWFKKKINWNWFW